MMNIFISLHEKIERRAKMWDSLFIMVQLDDSFMNILQTFILQNSSSISAQIIRIIFKRIQSISQIFYKKWQINIQLFTLFLMLVSQCTTYNVHVFYLFETICWIKCLCTDHVSLNKFIHLIFSFGIITWNSSKIGKFERREAKTSITVFSFWHSIEINIFFAFPHKQIFKLIDNQGHSNNFQKI